MILYEVNAEIPKELSQDYLDWLGPHVEKILKEPGFVSAQVYREEAQSDAHRARFTVHYSLKSREDLENYFKGPAKKFREEGLVKFGSHLTTQRRVLEQI